MFLSYKLSFILVLCSAVFCAPQTKTKSYTEEKQCVIPKGLVDEIASYESVVKDILDYVITGPFKNKTYDELAVFVDKFGARPSGTEVLEKSIDYMIQLTKDESIHDIVTEDVQVPRWTRGEEKITMLEPRLKNLAVLGLGTSVSTPLEGITAEVVVISDFDTLLKAPREDVNGKIVLYDPHYSSYHETVKYRSQGATKAAEKGAVASLVRSIAPFSINSPHTGSQNYAENVTKIPTAAITIEDADLIRRMYDRGEKIKLNIKMFSTLDTNKTSRNTLIDLKGRNKPEQLVIVSGHIDSWDVGQGAMDDGGGMFISWAVPVVLKRLSLRPKRTIRTIFWTAEELGLIGAHAYEEKHRNENNINFIMESDEGTFSPLGLEVAGNQEARCIVAEVLKLFESINASRLIESDSPGSDITVLVKDGIPGASLHNANNKYFWFHHTEGDTMNVQDPTEMNLATAFWTAVTYVIADLSVDIPRGAIK